MNRTWLPLDYRSSATAGILLASALLAPTHAGQGAQYFPIPVGLLRQDSELNRAKSNQSDTLTLEPGKPIEREIAVNETHSYRIVLAAGQYLHVIVDQRDANVKIHWFAPDGKRLGTVNRVNTSLPTPIFLLAEVGGEYRLDVRHARVPFATRISARYEVKIVEVRTPTQQDESRATAEQRLMEGLDLSAQKTPEALQKSNDKFQEALRLFESIGDLRGQANALTTLHRHFTWRETQKSLEYGNRAVSVWRALGETHEEIWMLIFCGQGYRILGELDKALDYYEQALTLSRATGDRVGEHSALAFLKALYDDIGDRQNSAQLKEELEPFEDERIAAEKEEKDAAANHLIEEATELVQQATQQSREKAVEKYEAAFQIFRSVGSSAGQVKTLVNLSQLYSLQDNKQKALNYLDQAIRFLHASFKTTEELAIAGQWFDLVGMAYEDLGEKHRAIETYEFMIPVWQARDSIHGESFLLERIGVIYDSIGDKQKALEYLNRTLRLLQSVRGNDDPYEAPVLGRIAQIERDRGNLTEARSRIEAALNIIESRRSKIVSQELRSSYFVQAQRYYEFYIDLLMRLDKQQPSGEHAAKALQANERARARSLIETLVETRTNIREGIDPVLLQREQSLQQQLNAKAAEQVQLLSMKHTGEQAAAAGKELTTLTNEYQQLQSEIRRVSPRYSALTQPVPLTLSQIQQVLDADTVLLEYSLGDERSYLWVVTTESFRSYELPARAFIESEVRQLLGLLSDGKRWATTNQTAADFTKGASKLSQMLLAPAAAQLSNKRLLIVADGALQYLAFGALPSPKSRNGQAISDEARPLIADYEIVTLPSVSTLAVLRSKTDKRAPATKCVAVFADPVFENTDERISKPMLAKPHGRAPRRDDSRAPPPTPAVTNPSLELPTELERAIREVLTSDKSGNSTTRISRLPFTRREAEWIFASASPRKAMKALDFQASRARATSREISGYRIVHFATHGLLNSEHPELSGIILSLVNEQGQPVDGFLRLHEIYNLKLSADLVVLSACQTGLGKEIRGEGLVGLTRGFMYAGAPRVLASLWKVDDVSTSELMRIFYQKMLRERKPAATALRDAQLEMWRSKRWREPYYWAAFQLHGEWK